MDYLTKDDPNHLGLRCNTLPEPQMALITSGCVPFSADPEGLNSMHMAAVHHQAEATQILLVRAPPQHGLSYTNMALITSDCGAMRSLGIEWP